MSKALTRTDFNFPGQKSVYHGKVRDVYNINDEKLVMVATDRISAFDVVLPEGIPYKGQMLNQIAAKFLDATTDICPNWKMATPDPMVTVGVMCQGFPVEMIVRGYLCGSAWRAYKNGVREICGVQLPEGMKENQKFPEPIITPTTKAEMGLHDEDISKEEILKQGLATPEEYEILEKYTLALFKRGTEIAAERGLILVDTKYEFGKHNGTIYDDSIVRSNQTESADDKFSGNDHQNNNDIQSVHRCQTDQRGTYQQLVCKRIHKFTEVRYQIVLSGDFPIQHIRQAGNTEDHKCDPLICCSGNIK